MAMGELERLRARLAEAEAVIAALRRGEVDAIVGESQFAYLRLREAEEARERSERLYRGLAANLPGGAAFILDRDLRYVLAEGEALTFVGFTGDMFTGRTAHEALPAELADQYEPMFRRVLAGESFEYEHEGHGRHWITRGVPIRDDDGTVTHILAVSYDITARKHAEEEVRQLNETLERRVAERTGMLQVLNDVAAAANEAHDIEEALEFVLRRVSEYNGWCFGHAYLVDPADLHVLVPVRTYYAADSGRFRAFRRATLGNRLRPGQGLPGRAVATRSIQWAEDLAEELAGRRATVGDELGLVCGAAFPIYAGGDVVGVLEFFSDKAIEPSDRLLESMASIGTQLGRVVERQRFEQQLARALLAEQQRLGQDLHDTVGQQLAGLALLADRLAERATAQSAPDPAALSELATGLRRALHDARSVVRDLLPLAMVQAEDYSAALQELCATIAQRHGVPCELECGRPVAVDDAEVAVHLYRIAAEALTNAAKHARATQIVLRVGHEDDLLVCEVSDDGVGIGEGDEIGHGSGLWIMRHRAKVMGASFDVWRARAGGTMVRWTVPRWRLQGAPAGAGDGDEGA